MLFANGNATGLELNNDFVIVNNSFDVLISHSGDSLLTDTIRDLLS